MIISLDTSTPTCHIGVYVDDTWHDHSWKAGRELAHHLLSYLREATAAHGGSLESISGVVAMKGPGSFTGLRIGLTVLNTIASTQSIPIVGETGDTWRQDGLERLRAGADDELVMPEYGGEPNITTPRK